MVERYAAKLRASDSTVLDPSMRVSELDGLIARNYAWAPDDAGAFKHFWYYPQTSPYEPRRGVRGRHRAYETESTMDVPLKVSDLTDALHRANPKDPIAVVLAERPDLVAIVTRIQETQNAPYAELRMNSLGADFEPFPACRLILAFYGMEKFDPRLPRSTKGALMQGAPLMDELDGEDRGTWPFPLPPPQEASSSNGRSALPLRLVESPEISIHDIAPAPQQEFSVSHGDGLKLFPQEYHRMVMRSAQRAGLPYAAAKEIASASLFSAATGQSCIQETLELLACCYECAPKLRIEELDAAGLPAFAIAPRAIDLAYAKALESGIGHVTLAGVKSSPLLYPMPLAAAARGAVVAIADLNGRKLYLSGPGKAGTWLLAISDITPTWAIQSHSTEQPTSKGAPSLDELVTPSITGSMSSGENIRIVCLHLKNSASEIEDNIAKIIECVDDDRKKFINSREMNDVYRSIKSDGIFLSIMEFHALKTSSANGLLPDELENWSAPDK